ncbi:MAG: hypothetical protein AVDCRST_MAG25-906, partial [uncultured Rubrobacteraceae bacterium]
AAEPDADTRFVSTGRVRLRSPRPRRRRRHSLRGTGGADLPRHPLAM